MAPPKVVLMVLCNIIILKIYLACLFVLDSLIHTLFFNLVSMQVAEKPSIALSIASQLSHGQVVLLIFNILKP